MPWLNSTNYRQNQYVSIWVFFPTGDVWPTYAIENSVLQVVVGIFHPTDHAASRSQKYRGCKTCICYIIDAYHVEICTFAGL